MDKFRRETDKSSDAAKKTIRAIAIGEVLSEDVRGVGSSNQSKQTRKNKRKKKKRTAAALRKRLSELSLLQKVPKPQPAYLTPSLFPCNIGLIRRDKVLDQRHQREINCVPAILEHVRQFERYLDVKGLKAKNFKYAWHSELLIDGLRVVVHTYSVKGKTVVIEVDRFKAEAGHTTLLVKVPTRFLM